MKRVVLLGDSIRLGYEGTVRAELAQEAFVWSPPENGQHSVHLLLNAWVWIMAQQPDIVHVNSGLWDTRRVLRGVPGNVVPLEQYRENVRRLIEVGQKHAGARVIWATTTPVREAAAIQGHWRKGLAGRDGSEVERYNAVAVEVARAMGARVNDLHAVVMAQGRDKMLLEDGTHYTAAGYEVLGQAVARAVRESF